MEMQLLKIIYVILITLPEVHGVGENGTNLVVGIDSDFKPNSTLATSESTLESPATTITTATDDTIPIVIGVLASVLIIIAVIAFWWFRVKQSRQPQPPAPEWISEINSRCKDLEGDWVELEILSKAVQYQQHVDKKKLDVVPKRKKDRARSRTVCFNNSIMEQILPGTSSSSHADIADSALQENFRISDLTKNVVSGWSTLPNPKKGRKTSTENAEPIETTASVSSKEATVGDGENEIRFATFRRPSQLTDKILRNSLEVDSTSFRVPLPKKDFTHDLTEDVQVSPMSSSCDSDYKQRHSPVSIEIEKDIDNHDDDSNTCRRDIREDFPPELPGPVQAITSTCNTHENMDEIELCESFKRTMSAKGIVFSD